MKVLLKILSIVAVCFMVISCSKESLETENFEIAKPSEEVSQKALTIRGGFINDVTILVSDFCIARPTGNKNLVFGLNGRLQVGDYLYVLQTNGNFVCYNLAKGNGRLTKPVWATGTQNTPTTRMYFQSDGNIVAYNNDSLSNDYWNSGTPNYSSVTYKFQNDGNLVVTIGSLGRRTIFDAKRDMPDIYRENF